MEGEWAVLWGTCVVEGSLAEIDMEESGEIYPVSQSSVELWIGIWGGEVEMESYGRNGSQSDLAPIISVMGGMGECSSPFIGWSRQTLTWDF